MINSISCAKGRKIPHACLSGTALLLSMLFLGSAGCGTHRTAAKKNDDFFTSGSREADQRASQRMAKEEQLTGTGEGAGEKGAKKAEVATNTNGVANGTNQAAQTQGKLSLYDRLGQDAGISNIV